MCLKLSSPPRCNNSYYLFSFVFNRNKKGKKSAAANLETLVSKLASQHADWGTANCQTESGRSDTFVYFSHWLPLDHQQGLCFLGTFTSLSNEIETSQQKGQLIRVISNKPWEIWAVEYPESFLRFNTLCGYPHSLVGEVLILHILMSCKIDKPRLILLSPLL